MYVAGRLLLGFGNSLAQMASPVLLVEICHPQHRGKVTTIYNCLWNLGALRTYPSDESVGPGVLTGSSCRMACMGNYVYQKRLVLAQFDHPPNPPRCHSDRLHLL